MTAPVRPKRPRKVTIPDEVSKSQFEALTGYSAKQLTRFIQSTDIPHRREGVEIFFPWPATRAWLHRYLEEKGKRAAQPENQDDARRRKESAEAEMAEIELAQARNELIRASDAEAWLADAFARVRARLDNLAPRVAAASFGAQTIQEAQSRIQPVLDEVFAELRKTDDIPVYEEPSDDDRETEASASE